MPLAGADPEDGPVTVTVRRLRIAPDVDHLADVLAPQLLAIDAVAEQARRAVADKDPFAVGDWRGGAVRVGAVRGLLLLVLDFCFPELLAVAAIEAEQGAVRAF